MSARLRPGIVSLEALRERLDVLGEAAEWEGLERRLPPRHRGGDAQVGFDRTRELDRGAEALATRRGKPGTDAAVLRSLDLIHDQQRCEGLCLLFEQLGGGRVDRAHQRDQLPRGVQPSRPAVLVQLPDHRGHFGTARDLAQRAVEGDPDEVLRVLDRGRLGRDDDETPPGQQEEIEDVECAARAEIEHDVIDVETTDLANQHLLLAVRRVGHLEQRLIAAHEPEVGNRGLDHQVRQARHVAGQQMR
jgi:hypothetical protein